MLSSAELALVERDRRLAGLGLMLDAAALQAWISERTGETAVVHPRRLRYKPGTSCVLSFELESASGTQLCLAQTHAAESAAKASKTVWTASAGSLLAADTGLPMVVTAFVADRDVPALDQLHDDHGRRRLLRRVLPARPDLVSATPRTLSYNPQRRWVGLLELEGTRPVVLRAYRRHVLAAHAHAYNVLRAGAPRTPAILGGTRRHGLLAVEWVHGRELASDGAGRANDQAAAGAAVARLHERRPVKLPPLRPEDEATAVRAAAEQVCSLLPDLGDEVTRLAERLTARLLTLPTDRANLHGDFSADQVVVDEVGDVALIDLDAAAVGDPAVDLACAAAAASRASTADPRAPMDALYAGYASVRPLPSPERLAVHGAAHLLRRAPEPFRDREAHWPAQVRQLVDRSACWLTGTPSLDERAW